MTYPKQTPPLKRPELIQPHELVDVEHGSADDLLAIRMDLLHGANFNDPAPFNGERDGPGRSACCQRCTLEDAGILPHSD